MAPGQWVAHYRIQQRLGSGGMGVVYKALDTHLNRVVAIKLLPPEVVADAGRRQRFIQEAHAASALDHPNIVTVYDISEADGCQFIVMQCVSGRTMRAVLARGALPVPDVLRYGIQIADALACAHRRGIVHRDLKPENVMLTGDEQVKILDFGLAKLTEVVEPVESTSPVTLDPGPGATQVGEVLGTVAYMSPEQAQGRKVDVRTDIFSFGVVLYEMASGRQPFRGDSRIAALSAIVRDQPAELSGVPPELARLISRAMRKDPERRAQSMADLRNALVDLKEETESGSAASIVAHARRRHRIPVAALALVAVGAAAWVRFATGTSEPSQPPRVVPFTSFAGNEYHPTFSPDGNQIAFSWDGERGDNLDIYVKLIDAGGPLRLTTDPAPDRFPAWSHDGKQIAFYRETQGEQGEIWIVPALGGGLERRVATGYRQQFYADGAVTWSADGKWLALTDRTSPLEPVSVFMLSLETGEKRRMTTPGDASYWDGNPVLSPDGRRLAFARRHGTSHEILCMQALDSQGRPSGELQHLTNKAEYISGLAWTRDGSSIVFSANIAGSRGLHRISVDNRSRNGTPERLGSVSDDAAAPAISRAGRLAFQQSVTDVNIWRRSVPPGTGAAVQLVASTRRDTAAQYSPDGRRIAFVSSRSGAEEVWIVENDGSRAAPATAMNGATLGSPRWSPDGRWIAFDCSKDGHRDIFLVAVEGGFLRRLTSEPSEDVRPSWSMDGRWVYFGSNRSREWQVWKAPVDSGAPVQVTRHGGREAFESFDGKFVYYAKPSPARGIWRVPATGGEEILAIDGPAQGGWSINPEGIAFFTFFESGPVIQFFRFSTRAVSPIGVLPKGTRLETASNHLAVSRDLRWILHNQIDRVESDIMLVENFR